MDFWKIGQDFGTTSLVLIVVWKLVNRWAAAFLSSQRDQATAMTNQATAMATLAQVVRDGQQDQREVLIAVRVLAEKIDQQKQYVLAIDQKLEDRG